MSSTVTAQKKKKAAKTKETNEQKVEEVIENFGVDSNDLVETKVEELKVEESKAETIVEEIKETLGEEKIPEIAKKIITDIIVHDSIKKIVGPTLIEIISEDIRKKSMVLNKDYVETINILIKKTPSLFSDIEKSIYEIMKDGKVDTNDIPHLIKIIQKLYESIFSIKLKLNNEQQTAICCELIKNIFKIMIKERKIQVDLDKQDKYLDQFNKLIESCTGLLSFQKILKSKGCFSSLFGKK